MVKWDCKEFGIEWWSPFKDLGVHQSPLCWHRRRVTYFSLHCKTGLTADCFWRPVYRAQTLWSRHHSSEFYKALCYNKSLILVWTKVLHELAIHEMFIPSLLCTQPAQMFSCSIPLAEDLLLIFTLPAFTHAVGAAFCINIVCVCWNTVWDQVRIPVLFWPQQHCSQKRAGERFLAELETTKSNQTPITRVVQEEPTKLLACVHFLQQKTGLRSLSFQSSICSAERWWLGLCP